MDDFALFEVIKKAFTVEKGKILLVELTSDQLSELKPEIFCDLDSYEMKASELRMNERRFAIFDYLEQEELIYIYSGLTFKKVQKVTTGETIDFITIDHEEVNLNDVRKDFAQLSSRLRNTKAS